MSGPSEVRSVAADNPFVTGDAPKPLGEGYSGSVLCCEALSDAVQRHCGRAQEPAVGGWQLAPAGIVGRHCFVHVGWA